MDETIVYLIRHSEPTQKNNFNNVKFSDNFQDSNEKTILSVSGEKKAEALSKLSEFEGINAVYSSSYVRALGTAKYFALEANTVINIDERFNERKIGLMGDMEWQEFSRLQAKDLDFKLSGGESFNIVKKRMVEAMKNLLMFEAGNKVVIVSHAFAITTLLSAWCEIGKNYDDEIILSYGDKTIVDGRWNAPAVFKITFDGMNVKNIEFLDM